MFYEKKHYNKRVFRKYCLSNFQSKYIDRLHADATAIIVERVLKVLLAVLFEILLQPNRVLAIAISTALQDSDRSD